MAALTAAQRRAIPSGAFALPELRMFPLVDLKRANNAMGRLHNSKVWRSLTPAQRKRAFHRILDAQLRFHRKRPRGKR